MVQPWFMLNISSTPLSRNALVDDLKRHIQKWKEEGDQIIVMGDINEYINSSSVMAFFKHLDMSELISERHGGKGLATTRSNKSGQAIDRI
eukprot:9312106-Ditylum_brightwellii.AAC.1